MLMSSPEDILKVQNLVVRFKQGLQSVTAVADVSFNLKRGSTVALIGESGSGKSTVATAICGLGPLTQGQVVFEGETISRADDPALAAGAAGIQIVFQDPRSSLDPRWVVWRSIIEPCASRYRRDPDKGRARAIELLKRVGLNGDLADYKPGQLSGGQRQRVTIARAIAPAPKLIILDEAVSALDVSVRNEILALLEELKSGTDLSYLFITHDMGAVVQIASEVAVMFLGRLVEFGPAAEIIAKPAHPYTQRLIGAVPNFHTKLRARERRGIGNGTRLSIGADPSGGCQYRLRCPHARDICTTSVPPTRELFGRTVACHLAETIGR